MEVTQLFDPFNCSAPSSKGGGLIYVLIGLAVFALVGYFWYTGKKLEDIKFEF